MNNGSPIPRTRPQTFAKRPRPPLPQIRDASTRARAEEDDLLVQLEDAVERVDEVEDNDIPRVIGSLERLKTALMIRVIAPQNLHAGLNVPLVDVDKAAELLSVTSAYVYELAREGKIIPIRFGKYIRFRPADLEEWISQHRDCPVTTGRRGPRMRRP